MQSKPSNAQQLLKLIEQEHATRIECRRCVMREPVYPRWTGFALLILYLVAGSVTAFMQCPWQVSAAFFIVPGLGVVRAFVPRGKNAR